MSRHADAVPASAERLPFLYNWLQKRVSSSTHCVRGPHSSSGVYAPRGNASTVLYIAAELCPTAAAPRIRSRLAAVSRLADTDSDAEPSNTRLGLLIPVRTREHPRLLQLHPIEELNGAPEHILADVGLDPGRD